MPKVYHTAQSVVQLPLLATSKVCYLCRQEKPLEDFCKDRKQPDGTRGICKFCHKTQATQDRRNKGVLSVGHQTASIIGKGTRECDTCNKEKPLNEFRPYTNKKYGYHKQCNNCRNEQEKQKRREQGINAPLQSFVPTPDGNRICTTCLVEQPLTSFAKNKAAKYGYESQCKPCKKKVKQVYQAAHREPPKIRDKDGNFLAFKWCSGCQSEKPLDAFYKRPVTKKTPRGAAGKCKTCTQQHRKDMAAKRRMSAPPTKTCKDCKIDRPIACFNKDNTKDGYNARCRDCSSIWQSKYVNKRDALAPIHNKRRRADQQELTVGKINYRHILDRYGLFCYICEQPIEFKKLQFDHVIPLRPRKGEAQGLHTQDNLKPVHGVCNLRKSNRPFEQLTPFQRRGPDAQ